MSNNSEVRPQAGVMELVSGIITDVQVLIKQQLALSRHEFKGEIGHARKAGYLVGIGMAIGVMGSVLLSVMLVHLLARMAPELPLWACYGVIGAPIAALGGILCVVGIQRFGALNTATVKVAHDVREKING